MSISGIYTITNIINSKQYVGQSKDINRRWSVHKYELNNNVHCNKHLQNAWNKYGEDNFVFKILEECEIDKLNEREQYWIKELDTFNNGYNLDIGGKGISGYRHTEEQIEKMRRIQNPKIVLQFDLDFNLIKEWTGGVSHIDRKLGYTKECIKLRCEHTIKNKMTPYKNSYWVYKEEYENNSFSWTSYLNNFAIPDDKCICQYDYKLNLIKKWDSHKSLKENGYSLKPILNICNQTGTQRVYKNSIWAYDGYDFSDGYFKLEDGEYKKGIHNKRKINMKESKNGDVIKTFDSMSDACIYMGKNKSDVSKICVSISEGYKYNGYYWEYAD